jgi:hypothetical protein
MTVGEAPVTEKLRDVMPLAVFGLHAMAALLPVPEPEMTDVYVCEAESETVSVPLAVFQTAIPHRMSPEAEEVTESVPLAAPTTPETC